MDRFLEHTMCLCMLYVLAIFVIFSIIRMCQKMLLLQHDQSRVILVLGLFRVCVCVCGAIHKTEFFFKVSQFTIGLGLVKIDHHVMSCLCCIIISAYLDSF